LTVAEVKASSELFQIKILAVINNHDIAKSGRVEFAKPTPLSCLIYQTCLVGCGNLNFTDVHCIYLPSRLSNASHYHRHSVNACCNALADLLSGSIKQRQRFGRFLDCLGLRDNLTFRENTIERVSE
jgi:hypothetical protein